MIALFFASSNPQLSRATFHHYLAQLPHFLQSNILRYHRWEDRQVSLLGKLLVKQFLLHFQPNFMLNDLKVDEYGRPHISDSFDFNISHSGSYVVCVYSDEGRIGIDIELVKEIDLDVFDDYFTGVELELIQSSNNYEIFYQFWTLKEAALKADGRGLLIPLKEVEIHTDNITIGATSLYYKRIDLIPDYILHLATFKPLIGEPYVSEITFENWLD